MSRKAVVLVVVGTISILGAVFLYLFMFRGGEVGDTQEVAQPTKVLKSEYTQGTKQIHKGEFIGADGKTISYMDGGSKKQLLLGDEIMVFCTDTDLKRLTLENYWEGFGKLYNPEDVNGLTPSGEYIVVISSYKDGSSTVHSLIFDKDSCVQ